MFYHQDCSVNISALFNVLDRYGYMLTWYRYWALEMIFVRSEVIKCSWLATIWDSVALESITAWLFVSNYPSSSCFSLVILFNSVSVGNVIKSKILDSRHLSLRPTSTCIFWCIDSRTTSALFNRIHTFLITFILLLFLHPTSHLTRVEDYLLIYAFKRYLCS